MAEVTCMKLENFQVEVSARHLKVKADEPMFLGGEDKGFSPFELLLASLGA